MNLSRRLLDWYFRPKVFELDGRIYVWLGVTVFKKALLSLVKPAPGNEKSSYRLASRNVQGLQAFERKTRRNEALHVLALVPSVVGLALAGTSHALLSAALVVIVVANFHPILLQRYNRIRIQRALTRHRSGPAL